MLNTRRLAYAPSGAWVTDSESESTFGDVCRYLLPPNFSSIYCHQETESEMRYMRVNHIEMILTSYFVP